MASLETTKDIRAAVMRTMTDMNVARATKSMLLPHVFSLPSEPVRNPKAWRAVRQRKLAEILPALSDQGELVCVELECHELPSLADGPLYSWPNDGPLDRDALSKGIRRRWLRRRPEKLTKTYSCPQIEEHFSQGGLEFDNHPPVGLSWLDISHVYMHLHHLGHITKWRPWWIRSLSGFLRAHHCPPPLALVQIDEKTPHARYACPESGEEHYVYLSYYSAFRIKRLAEIHFALRDQEVRHEFW